MWKIMKNGQYKKQGVIDVKSLFKCSVCSYVHEGDHAPEHCPKCGVGPEKFEKLSDEAVEKVYSSDRTNDIHMEIISLCDHLIELSTEGAEIDLDPACKKLFENAIQEAWVIKQRCKAELENHMKKGKW
jgi:hypothetical protein